MDKQVLTQLALQLQQSPTLQINELVCYQQAMGRHILHLGFGEADFPIQEDVLKAYQAASLRTEYLPAAGLLKLREAIARFQTRRLGELVNSSQVVITPGSKSLLFALFDVLQGDVLLPRPSWVSYEPQIIHAGKKIFWIETDETDRHAITKSALEAAYTNALRQSANPRIMLVNTPSNPTGRVFSPSNLALISTFCREHNIVLLSDEIYGDICFVKTEPLAHNSSVFNMTEARARTAIITSGLSKTYSAGGWRIGYGIFPDNAFGVEVQAAIIAYGSECWSAAPSPAQEAATVAFQPNTIMDRYRSAVVSLHHVCTTRLYVALKDCGLSVPEPQGAFYVYPSFGPYTKELLLLGIVTSADLAKWLLEEYSIATLPGSAFAEDDNGLPGGRYRLRMATSCLYFGKHYRKYSHGYDMLKGKIDPENMHLPLLAQAVDAIVRATSKLKALRA